MPLHVHQRPLRLDRVLPEVGRVAIVQKRVEDWIKAAEDTAGVQLYKAEEVSTETDDAEVFSFSAMGLNEAELKGVSGESYLRQADTRGPTMEIPTKSGVGTETVWLFEHPTCPYRTITKQIRRGAVRRCVEMAPPAHIWPSKANEAHERCTRARGESSRVKEMVDRATALPSLADWASRFQTRTPDGMEDGSARTPPPRRTRGSDEEGEGDMGIEEVLGDDTPAIGTAGSTPGPKRLRLSGKSSPVAGMSMEAVLAAVDSDDIKVSDSISNDGDADDAGEGLYIIL